ncbi:MAG: LysE family translocator, partial [Candidatus Eisenbacteria bacterium]
MSNDLGAFLIVSTVVIVTPGQDTALTIRNALGGGSRAGVFTALGVAMGQTVWTLASAAGITALLLASASAFTVIKLAGAAYLVFLGARSLFEAARGAKGPAPRAASCGERSMPPPVALRQGLLSALGNPKLAVFFVS